MDSTSTNKLITGAVLTGLINAVINGGIQYFFLRSYAPIPITVDSITNNIHTVLGTAVPLAITLAMILTVVSYYKVKQRKINFFPSVFWMVLKHGFFTFGVVTALAVLWQRIFGTIQVSLISALIMIGIIAGVISAIIEFLTIRASIVQSN